MTFHQLLFDHAAGFTLCKTFERVQDAPRNAGIGIAGVWNLDEIDVNYFSLKVTFGSGISTIESLEESKESRVQQRDEQRFVLQRNRLGRQIVKVAIANNTLRI